ncbi:MAG: hypothetical protein ACKVQB_03735 [Bacteroidia bacterium]
MINTPFKIQPVAAFYKLLAKNFLFIFPISLILSVPVFFIIKLSLVNTLGTEGIKEFIKLIEFVQSSKTAIQAEAMKNFISKYPTIASSIFGGFIVLLFVFAYIFNSTQQFLKSKSLGLDYKVLSLLTPDKNFLKILVYLVLSTGYVLFTFSFITLSIASNPVIGLIASIFIGLLFVRSFLVIPGIIMGEMPFLDSLKYSFQTISLGRAFKIIIFGILILFLLYFILSILVSPLTLILNTYSSLMYSNFLVMFLLIGCISVGLTSLFLRYGNFEEEKIA